MNTNFFFRTDLEKQNSRVTCDKNHINRDFEKGKSFNFSKWDPVTTYVNDTFKQDFVTYDGTLYVCLKSNTNVVPSSDKTHWGVAVAPSTLLGSDWAEFNINE